MYFRRLIVLLVVAAGTVALAASISKYKLHLRAGSSQPGHAYVRTLPNGERELVFSAREFGEIIRRLQPAPRVPGDVDAVIAYLSQKLFRGVELTFGLKVVEGKTQLVVYGVAIPETKDQRIVVYGSHTPGEFTLIDDFIRPVDEKISAVKIENDQLVFLNAGKPLYAHPLDVEP